MRLRFRWLMVASIFTFVILGVARPVSSDMLISRYDSFAKIPILDNGRIKPLDTFARSYLEGFYGKESLPELKAIEWLAELIFNPQKAYTRRIFNVPNPSVIDALSLERSKNHRYSYDELSDAMQKSFETLHPIFMKSKEELSLEQKQLLTLFNKVQVFVDLSKSVTLLFPLFEISDPNLAMMLGVEPGVTLNFMDVRKKNKILQQSAEEIIKKMEAKTGDITPQELKVVSLVRQMSQLDKDKLSQLFRVIPPQWNKESGVWFSPWSITYQGQGSPESMELLNEWGEVYQAYRFADNEQWNKASQSIYSNVVSMAQSGPFIKKLSIEVFFNNFGFFRKSLVFYLMSFLFLLTGFLIWPEIMRKAAFGALFIAFLFHLTGLCIRMYIMARPPVTNLYESIIFVGLIAALFGMILEWFKKNGIGLIVGSVIGTVLHFIGLRYDADGDTLGMLTAVLNTNFWLATHVVTITIGYGCSLVVGIIGHIYLLTRIFNPKDKARLADLFKNLRGTALVALFFSLFGTILGGIWADQSWGRFWGWDPKENGALFIVLWLAWLIHGRISGQIKELGFAVGMTCTTIIVSLAWFGVNLLSVGLHSYGFTENAALNLLIFGLAELIFAITCLAIIKLRKI